MALRFYDTLSKKLKVFTSLTPGKVRMYTCGPTVYNYAHIGNFRTYIFEDLLRRYLKFKGFEVTQVMNLTDVEDKVIKAVMETGMPLAELSQKYIDAFFEDLDTLGIEHAEVYPKATEHIDEIVKLIQKLMDKGFAYRSDDGSIYYSIGKFPEYGKLSGKKPEDLIPGARVSHDEYDKEQWADFALWKAWDTDDGDIYWETELGKGRPGWHIECSAMSMKYLGETFDIHTGGEDNIFPHHENEIAQSEAATEKIFVKYWLHSRHLMIDGKKMSKSFGNFYTLRDILNKGYTPMSIRYLLISTHYRQQLNLTFKGLDAAKTSIERLSEFRSMLSEYAHKGITGTDRTLTNILNEGLRKFEEALDDDLNISPALGVIFDMVRYINRFAASNGLSKLDAEYGLKIVKRINSVLGVLKDTTKELPQEIQKLIDEREQARKNKDWKTADEIRNKLLNMGLQIKDTPEGPKWLLKE